MPRPLSGWNTASSEASRGSFAPGRAPVKAAEAARRYRREPNILATAGELEIRGKTLISTFKDRHYYIRSHSSYMCDGMVGWQDLDALQARLFRDFRTVGPIPALLALTPAMDAIQWRIIWP